MVVGQILDGLVGALDPGIEEDEKINAAHGDDPVEEKAECAELDERIERRAEQPLERPLDQLKAVPKRCAHRADHRRSPLLFLWDYRLACSLGMGALRARRHSRSRMAANTINEKAPITLPNIIP